MAPVGALALLSLVAAVVAVACGGVGQPPSILTLERAFPVNENVEIEVLRARDSVRHSRILQGFNGVVDFSVGGTADPYLVGLYFTRVKLGTPPREYNVQIDTGSDILWVTCNACSDCPHTSGLGVDLTSYDSSGSSTAALVSCSDPVCGQIAFSSCSSQTNQCSYSFRYGDGSGTSGFYVSDMLYFNMVLGDAEVVNSSASIVFGCSTYQSGDLTNSDRAIDGIFGFGQQSLSVISQLSSRGLTPKVFSHCLKGANNGGGNGGGILVFGEILDPNIVYSPLVQSQPHYNLQMQSIAVNGQLLSIDPAVFATSSSQGTIIDSGTTLAYLVEEAYHPFVNAVTNTVLQNVKLVNSKGNQCYLVSASINDIFPPVSLNFVGASMVLRPEDYLIHMGFFDGAAMWCIGFQKIQGQGTTILGDLVLKDKIFVYDLVQQRIGWANYDCSSSVNVSIKFGRDGYVNAGQLSVSSSPRNTNFGLISLAGVLQSLIITSQILVNLYLSGSMT